MRTTRFKAATVAVSFVLAATPASAQTPAPSGSAPAPAPPPSPPPTGTFSEVSILSGAVVTFAGFLVFLDALAKMGKLDGVCVSHATGASSCPESASSAITSADAELAVGGIGTLVGITLLTIGYFTYDRAYAPPTQTSGVTLHLAPGGIGGTF